MENEVNKRKPGSITLQVLIGFAFGALGGIIGGMLIKGTELMWLLIGIICGLVMGIGIRSMFGSGKKAN